MRGSVGFERSRTQRHLSLDWAINGVIPDHLIEKRPPILQSLIEITHTLFYRFSTLKVVVVVNDAVDIVDAHSVNPDVVARVVKITPVEIRIPVDHIARRRERQAIWMVEASLG